MAKIMNSAHHKHSILILEKLSEAMKNKSKNKDMLSYKIQSLKNQVEEEEKIAESLKYWLNDDYLILHNINLYKEGRTAEVNHIVISPKAIFILETKIFATNINVNQYGEWTRLFYDDHGRIIKEGMPSPIEENRKNLVVMQDFLEEVKDRFFKDNINVPIIPIVVLGNPRTVIERTEENKDILSSIVRLEALDVFIKKREENLPDILSKFKIKSLCELFIEMTVPVHFNALREFRINIHDFRAPKHFNRIIGKEEDDGSLQCFCCNEPMKVEEGKFIKQWKCSQEEVCPTYIPYNVFSEFIIEEESTISKTTYQNPVEHKTKSYNPIIIGEQNEEEDFLNKSGDLRDFGVSIETSEKKEKNNFFSKIKLLFSKSIGSCPECSDGKLIDKTDANGNRIYMCSNFPSCKHVEYPDEK